MWLRRKRNKHGRQKLAIKKQIVECIQTIYDPEIPVNIYDLGLIYNISVDPSFCAEIKMTLTTPGCPVAQTFPGMIEQKIRETVAGLTDVHVVVIWDPPWSPERMSESARVTLGLF